MEVVALKVPDLKSYNAEVYKKVLGELLPQLNFSLVCIAGSTQGQDFAPGLAVGLGTACITSVERVFSENGRIRFVRSINGGKITADVLPEMETTIITVQPGSFKPCQYDNPPTGNIETRTMSFSPAKSKNIGLERVQEENSALTEARIVVAAGRGVGKEKNLAVVDKLAAILPKSAVGGSRPLCDLGWMEFRQQIGITGSTVEPDLYLACGISGASQHLSGMRGSGFIVSINLDPNAAIFNVSDVCVVEDLNTFIPILVEQYDKMQAST
ncbi:MAG: electron transfer flavoprotein subunit alpha/FixB family protein [Proteobacteria bacterium]|nr:electron transfer flavoprotein subunit alpha/FixB family protein [Pseudomonadota bacterium]